MDRREIMKYSSMLFAAFILIVNTASVYADEVKVLTELKFSKPELNVDGWSFGSQDGGQLKYSKDDRLGESGDGSLHATYPKTIGGSGGVFVWAGFNVVKYDTRDLFIEFWAKTHKVQGLKFLKIFGQIDPKTQGMANTTFALAYAGQTYRGQFTQIAFGDGKDIRNDMQNIVNLNGRTPDWVGRSYHLDKPAIVETPQNSYFKLEDGKWHKFRMRAKFNSVDPETGEEIADGAYYLEIDDVIYADARGLLNRHKDNLPIRNINFFDWSQDAEHSFDVWIDDVVISTGGFPSAPMAPKATIQ